MCGFMVEREVVRLKKGGNVGSIRIQHVGQTAVVLQLSTSVSYLAISKRGFRIHGFESLIDLRI